MILVKTQELKDGMILAADVCLSGIALPLAKKGLVLNALHIEKLLSHGVGFVYIEPAENYKGQVGQSLVIDSVKSDIIFEGKIEIKGSVESNKLIEAGQSIIIEGDIGDGCKIISRSGVIVIKGFVYGTADNPVNLQAMQKISIGSASHSIIKTESDFIAQGNVIDTTVSARGEVKINGSVIRSRINTNVKAILGEYGNKEGEPCVITVMPLEFQETVQELLKIDSTITTLSKEKSQLQNTIDLIKKLAGNIEQLPQDKKIEIAKQVKRFQDITGEISVLSTNKTELAKKIQEILSIRRVIVNGTIYPNAKVQIGNKAITVETIEQRIAFSVENGNVVIKKL